MSETTENPFQSPERCDAVAVHGGLSSGVVALLWVGAIVLLGLKALAWVFVTAPDLLVVFIAAGLAMSLTRRMRRRVALWTAWSFAIPGVALVLSQLRRPGSETPFRLGRFLVRIGVVLALVVALFVAAGWAQFNPIVTDAAGEMQAYLLTACGYSAHYEDSYVRSASATMMILGDPFARTAGVLMMAIAAAGLLYRSGTLAIVTMVVAGLVVGLGGDILGTLLFFIAQVRSMEEGSSLFVQVASNTRLIFLFQLAIVYAIAARIGWETACEEHPPVE